MGVSDLHQKSSRLQKLTRVEFGSNCFKCFRDMPHFTFYLYGGEGGSNYAYDMFRIQNPLNAKFYNDRLSSISNIH